MTIRVLRLGSPRQPDEGPRLGTVRRPPRGVAKQDFARLDWYDVWFPTLAPSPELMKQGQLAQAGSEIEWRAFAKAYRAEMASGDARHAIALLATLSLETNFSLGCYCELEARCHRGLLRGLLAEAGAKLVD
jgi:uncharacterized protein YeaO (DUF488 family)